VKITRHTPVADLPDPMRVEEVAAKLDVSTGIVYAMVKAGQLGFRLGRLVRIPRAAVVSLLEPGIAS
jgi:excisionase family DNA binding protein